MPARGWRLQQTILEMTMGRGRHQAPKRSEALEVDPGLPGWPLGSAKIDKPARPELIQLLLQSLHSARRAQPLRTNDAECLTIQALGSAKRAASRSHEVRGL